MSEKTVNTELEELDDVEMIGEELEEEESYVIKLSKPYVFEGTSYNEIDLSGLENIKGRDILAAAKKYSRGGNVSVAPQLEMNFTIDIAVRATGLPREFFENMTPSLVFKVHSMVLNFFGREE